MNRVALSLSLLLVTAPTAGAEGIRSLGLTVSPVGVFAVGASTGLATGYSANLGWSFERADSRFAVGGHVASSMMFTEATPLSVHFVPWRGSLLRPYVGLGLSLVVPHSGQGSLGESDAPLRLGGEACIGVTAPLGEKVFLEGQARYQNFPRGGLGSARQVEIASAFLGLGVRL